MYALRRNFRLNILIRVIILFCLMLVLSKGMTMSESWVLTNVILIMLILGLGWEFIAYVERVQVDISNFLAAIKYRDFSLSYSEAIKGKASIQMYQSFNQILYSFRELKIEKEIHYQYLQNIIQHISVALLCYRDEGEVVIMNQAAHDLIGRPYLGNISFLKKYNEKLYEEILPMKSGDQSLLKLVLNGSMVQLSIRASTFKLKEHTYKLISLQDIKSELEEQELESWQKLIRVLTHEIMNSVTPIVSLAASINDSLTDVEGNRVPLAQLPEDTGEDLLVGVNAIENRSKGLLRFIHAYRNLTRVATPQFEKLDIGQLFDRLMNLFRPECERQGISYNIDIQGESLYVMADPDLIEQVMINLIKNAMEAVKDSDNKEIHLRANKDDNHNIYIQVEDNGWGIDPELQDKIFIPFFTTKRNGSGIGLSLSRQILRLHKGNITFHTIPGEGTVFTLTF